MAYPHYKFAVPLTATNGDAVFAATTCGAKAHWKAGPISYIVTRVALQKTATDSLVAAPVFSFRKACGGVTAAASGNQFAKITVRATGLREDGMHFNQGFTPTLIRAGYGITVVVTTMATDLFRAWAVVEPAWERLQNLGTGAFLSVTA